MRTVNFNYIRQAYGLLRNNGRFLSNRRLRRLAYLDVHQNNYKLYLLYMDYKKVMNSDAANNQTIAIVIIGSLCGICKWLPIRSCRVCLPSGKLISVSVCPLPK